MSVAPAGWRIDVVVPAPATQLFATALAPFAQAVSTFELAPGKDCRIQAYAPAEPDRAALGVALALAAAGAGVAEPSPCVAALPPVDWLDENRKDFPPIRVGRYRIHGAHDRSAVPAGAIGLQVDAATAFGTGRHESTQGCLIALDRLARRRRIGNGLDMGCGTAILAIAVARTWTAPVLAADVDAEAVRVARQNVRANHVDSLVAVTHGDGYRAAPVVRHGPYDLITANILAAPLCAMAPDLAARLLPGGAAVLSGLLRREERAVVDAHRAQGLQMVDRIRRGDWTTLVMDVPGVG